MEEILNKNLVFSLFEECIAPQHVWIVEETVPNRFTVVFVTDNAREDVLERLLQKILLHDSIGGTITAVYSVVDELQNIPVCIAKIHSCLASMLIPGKTQIFHADRECSVFPQPTIGEINEKKLMDLLGKKQIKSFAESLHYILNTVITTDSTQQQIYRIFRDVSHMIKKKLVDLSDTDELILEAIMDEAIVAHDKADQLLAGYIDRLKDFLLNHEQSVIYDQTTEDIVAKIASYMQKNYAETMELKRLAMSFGISSTYLSTLFRKYYNMTPTKYLISLRVEKAKDLIEKNPNVAFQQVAYLVGYDDAHYFSRIFKNITGLSPSEYRCTL